MSTWMDFYNIYAYFCSVVKALNDYNHGQ